MEKKLTFSSRFRKQHQKANANIKSAFLKRLKIFEQNPHDPILRNHVLSGNYKGFRSINITGDWRAIYSEKGSIIIFEMLGTHSQLYR